MFVERVAGLDEVESEERRRGGEHRGREGRRAAVERRVPEMWKVERRRVRTCSAAKFPAVPHGAQVQPAKRVRSVQDRYCVLVPVPVSASHRVQHKLLQILKRRLWSEKVHEDLNPALVGAIEVFRVGVGRDRLDHLKSGDFRAEPTFQTLFSFLACDRYQSCETHDHSPASASMLVASTTPSRATSSARESTKTPKCGNLQICATLAENSASRLSSE